MAAVPKGLDFISQLLYPRPERSSDNILFIRIELPGSAQLTHTRREGKFYRSVSGDRERENTHLASPWKTRWYHDLKI